jgi:hypothetical protein
MQDPVDQALLGLLTYTSTVSTCVCAAVHATAALLLHFPSTLQSNTEAGGGQLVERRRGHGSVAIRNVPICANLFPLKVLLDRLYHYDVSFATTRSRSRGTGACEYDSGIDNSCRSGTMRYGTLDSDKCTRPRLSCAHLTVCSTLCTCCVPVPACCCSPSRT